ncbi:MAG: GNAT family N-acetyltransferase [Sandaracinaceae bacterium]|nr:GNAT family N-acetyltransferase [Sandaracinaceae bacterium]
MNAGPVRLETDRLVLIAPLDVEHAPAVADFYTRNRAHFAPWDPVRARSFFTKAHWREQLLLDAELLEEGVSARFFVTPRGSDRVVGHVHFANVVYGAFQACHLGFGIDAELVGQGMMREAIEAGIAWVFAELGLHRVEANHRPENVRSGQLLRRLGFVPQGYARDYLHIDGAWRDHVLTALTNERWKGR